jgi:hypothetical protein
VSTVGLAAALLASLIALAACGGAARATACVTGAPEVPRVAAAALGSLRASVARVLPERVARLYEEGTIVSGDAWSEDEPAPPAVSASADRPGGYEMRWWAPDGDEVLADVFALGSAASAQRFLALAASPRCRRDAHERAAVRPPLARALAWINPRGAAEADVYMVRGTRVYLVADIPAGQPPTTPGGTATLAGAFAAIEVLACLLPGARCAVPSSGGVPT